MTNEILMYRQSRSKDSQNCLISMNMGVLLKVLNELAVDDDYDIMLHRGIDALYEAFDAYDNKDGCQLTVFVYNYLYKKLSKYSKKQGMSKELLATLNTIKDLQVMLASRGIGLTKDMLLAFGFSEDVIKAYNKWVQ